MSRFLPIRHATLVASATFVGAMFSGIACAQSADTSAVEHPLGEHPAVLVKRLPPTVDTNRLILMHPAQLMVIDTPEPTFDHPAIAVQRLAKDSAAFDRYIAEPPIASKWLRKAPLTASTTAPMPR
jgi:hypothetical protein